MHRSEIFLSSPLAGAGKECAVVSDTVVTQSLPPKTPRDLLELNTILHPLTIYRECKVSDSLQHSQTTNSNSLHCLELLELLANFPASYQGREKEHRVLIPFLCQRPSLGILRFESHGDPNPDWRLRPATWQSCDTWACCSLCRPRPSSHKSHGDPELSDSHPQRWDAAGREE